MLGNFFKPRTNPLHGSGELTLQKVNVIKHIDAAIHSLQIERGLSAQTLAGKASGMLLVTQRDISDNLLGQVKESTSIAKIKMDPKLVKDLGALDELRGKVDSFSVGPRRPFAAYSEIISELICIIKDNIKHSVNNPTAKKAVEAHVCLILGKEFAGQERAHVASILGYNTPMDEDNYKFLLSLYKGQEDQLDDLFVKTATPALVKMYKDALANPVYQEVLAFRTAIIAQKDVGNFSVSSPIWFAKKTETINLLRSIDNASIDYLLSLVEN